MAYERCPKCRGRKIVMGLGCMEHMCPLCVGIGYVSVKTEPAITIPEVVEIEEIDLLPHAGSFQQEEKKKKKR